MVEYKIDDLFFEVDADVNFDEYDLFGWNGNRDGFISKLIGLYWTTHPKYKFYKFAKKNCEFLDLGAGNGGLSTWRNWMNPRRPDIKLHGIDLYQAEHCNNYEKFSLCNIDNQEIPYIDEYFDYIYMSHLLEHLKDPLKACAKIDRKLKRKGKLYIELPSVSTYSYPSLTKFMESGINVSTVNFFDDSTHLKTYETYELVDMFNSYAEYLVISSGVVQNDFMEDLLIYYGMKYDSTEAITYGIWSKLKWANFLILEKQ